MTSPNSSLLSSTSNDVLLAKDLLTSEETANWLGLKSSHTLEVWRSTKRYPELEYVKIGRLVRYRRVAVERFLQSRTIAAE